MRQLRRGRRQRVDSTNPAEVAEAADNLRQLMQFQPHNPNAEAAVLGAMMIDNGLVTGALSMLEPEHFFVPIHSRLFTKMKMLIAKGRVANPVTLHVYFEGESITHTDPASGEMIYHTVQSYLVEITGSMATMVAAAQVGRQVFDLAMLRAIADANREAMQAADLSRDPDADALDPAQVMSAVEERFSDIGDQIAQTAKRKGQYFGEAFAAYRHRATTADEASPSEGITIAGYSDWNEVVGRMAAGDLTYLGGRPSMGKTGVACAVAVGAAEASLAAAGDTAVEFLSLEMSKDTITQRMIANMMFVQGVTSTYREQKKGRFTAADIEALDAIQDRMDAIALHIDDPGTMYVEDFLPWLRRRKRAWAAKGKVLRLVVVDYLGLFETKKDIRNVQERVSYISRMAKKAMRDAEIAGVILVQLSRTLEQREDKRPQLSDLRDSGSLEQDADVVVFVYRDEYYLDRAQPPKGSAKHEAWYQEMLASRDRLELIGAKARESGLHRRTGYFFAAEQAVRSSDFYQTADMFEGV